MTQSAPAPGRIPLDHLTSDQLDQLYGDLDEARLLVRMKDAMHKSAEDELTALKTISTGYCGHCGRGDCSPTADQWYEQRKRADQLEDLLRIAHDTSNTSEAERARAVERAERAEAAIERVRALAIPFKRAHAGLNNYDIGRCVLARRILAALDGEQPAGSDSSD